MHTKPTTERWQPSRCELHPPRRNNFFFGKQLDVYHFQLETDYFNAKRWLINRLTVGFGVVCGLDVRECSSRDGILVVEPGVAIDGLGRELIVPSTIEMEDPRIMRNHDEEAVFHLVLRYWAGKKDPEPVYTSECPDQEQPGVICESPRLELRQGSAPKLKPTPDSICKSIDHCGLEHERLARIVSESCPDCPTDPSVPLADVCVPEGFDPAHSNERCQLSFTPEVRPIVYSNMLLKQLLECHLKPQ
ncbi:MAG: hypothetical protein AAFV88_03985 [Planctomycetota bacterium]